MVQYRTQGYAATLLIAELVVVTLAFWLWVFLWDTLSSTMFDWARCMAYNELLVVGILLAGGSKRRRGVYAEVRTDNSRDARRQTVVGILAVALVLFASESGRHYYWFLVSFVPCAYVALRMSKHYMPSLAATALFGKREREPVLIIGSPDQALRLGPWLRSKESIGLRPVGLLSEAPAADGLPETDREQWVEAGAGESWRQLGTEWIPRLPRFATARAGSGHSNAAAVAVKADVQAPRPAPTAWALPRLGSVADLKQVLEQHSIRQVLVLGLQWPEGFLRECIATCEHRGVRLHVASDLDEHFRHSVTLMEDSGVQLIGLREEPLESPLNRLAKRVMDIAIALPVVALVLPPAMVLVWLLHRWQSPGPVFFQQFRSGLRGRRFLMYKFRTMSVQNDDETRQVRRSDPRLFPAGAWMRRFSVDELPQFLNVLWGDMSAVGPRPHLPAHDEIFMQAMQNYRVRSAVKPGITGLAQVRGFRGGTQTDEDITRRVSSDIEYLERWTLELDLWILFRTLWQVVAPPKGAY